MQANLTFRRAETRDAPSVQAISAEAYLCAYRHQAGAPPKPAVEDYAPRIARGEVWLAATDGNPVAVLVAVPEPDHLLLYSLAVGTGAQGRGIGHALLAFAERLAASTGRRELRLFTNVRMRRNLALYHSAGFVRTGTRAHPSRPGEILVDMAKSVPTSC